MKLLVISTVWPEPTSTAAGSRMVQLLTTFRDQDWEVIYTSTATESEYCVDFKSIGISAASIKVNDPSFDAFVRELSPDIVLFDRFMTEEQFGWRVTEQCPNALRVLDTEDLHCLRRGRQTALKQGQDFVEADLFNEIAIRELASIHRCDLSIMISEYEYALLQRVFKIDASKIAYVPFLVESSDVHNPWSERQHFVTIGNFRHAPNLDSIHYLKKEIWPIIRRELPEAEMHVFGSYSRDNETQLHDEASGFLIKGRAEDAIAAISARRVLLAPLRFGAGLKGKLFDAMQSNTPSVTTPVGAEGIAARDEFPGTIAKSAEDLAEAAVELYRNEEVWNTASTKAQPLLQKRFAKEPFQLKLIHDLRKLQQNLIEHRQADFLGQMLNHHTLRSTEFMSRWIEEKNKRL